MGLLVGALLAACQHPTAPTHRSPSQVASWTPKLRSHAVLGALAELFEDLAAQDAQAAAAAAAGPGGVRAQARRLADPSLLRIALSSAAGRAFGLGALQLGSSLEG